MKKTNVRRSCWRLFSFPLFFLMATAPAWSKTSPQSQIHVTLLGQPCVLNGPLDATTMKTIHAIGPAQLYPNLDSLEGPVAKDEIRKALDKIRSSNHLPSLLDRYREKLGRRLEAQLAFVQALDQARKTYSSDALRQLGNKYLRSTEQAFLNPLIEAIQQKNSAKISDLANRAFEKFNESIEPDPESDFHRAIKKLGIEYFCSFEESEELTGSE